MPFGSLSNVLEIKSAEGFRGSSVLQQSYPLTGYTSGAAAPAAFSPLSLFSGGVQGVWYDPSDLTTMFEDSAGTTPVHIPGNGTADSPVGKILDKSGNGNHATQSTSTARPTLSALYNVLTHTEEFDNGAWTKYASSITANSTTAPNGTSTADSILETTANSYHACYYGTAAAVSVNGISYTFVCYLKANGRTRGYLSVVNGGGYVNFDLSSATISFGGNGTGETVTAQTITDTGNGWYKLTMTSSFTGVRNITPTVGLYDANGNPSYTGDPTKGFYVWGADCRASNDGVGLPAYQRVVDASTYDSTGFPYYLNADGVDDTLVTGNINFTGTNKVFLCAGLRKLAAAGGIPIEFTADSYATNGSFGLWAVNQGAGNNAWTWNSDATLRSFATYNDASPVTRVASGVTDLSAPSLVLRLNGSQVSSSVNSMGTGNFANAPLYLFMRLGGTYPYTGRAYGIIVRGAYSTATEITNTETWLNGKTKAY